MFNGKRIPSSGETPTVELTPVEVDAVLHGTTATVEIEPIDDDNATVEMIPLRPLDGDREVDVDQVVPVEQLKLARGSDAVPTQRALVHPRGVRRSREALRVEDIGLKIKDASSEEDE